MNNKGSVEESGWHVRAVVVVRRPMHPFPGARRRRQRRRLRQVRRVPLPRHQHRQVRRLQHRLHLQTRQKEFNFHFFTATTC